MDINVKVSVDLTERTVSALRGIFSGNSASASSQKERGERETSGSRPQHGEDTREEPQGIKEAHAGTAKPEAGDLSTEMPFDRETAPEEVKNGNPGASSENSSASSSQKKRKGGEKTEVKSAEPEAKQTEAKGEICSDETLRAHMDARFRALIGDDWENAVSSDPEAKKKQRQITNCFKQIAGKLGAVKPTLLPQGKRHEFVKEIKNITVGDDGEIQILPF